MLQFRDQPGLDAAYIPAAIPLPLTDEFLVRGRYSERTYIGSFAVCVYSVFETIASTSYVSIDLI